MFFLSFSKINMNDNNKNNIIIDESCAYHPNKKNIFLDLDHTIICSEESNLENLHHAYMYDYDFIYPYVTVARPNLQIFLDYLFDNFNVSIWTAASKNYASFIYDKFIKKYNSKRCLNLLLYNIHCDISFRYTSGSKSLKMLWELWEIPGYNKENTFIIDDLREVYNIQEKNCIKIKPFKLKVGENDKELFRIMNILKQLQ